MPKKKRGPSWSVGSARSGGSGRRADGTYWRTTKIGSFRYTTYSDDNSGGNFVAWILIAGMIGVAMLLAVLWFLTFWERNRLGAIALVVSVVGSIIGIAVLRARFRNMKAEKRLAYLRATFGEEGTLAILERRLWVGAPIAAVEELLGKASSIDEQVSAQGTKRVLKYFPDQGSYLVRVTVKDEQVVEWADRKGALGRAQA